MFSQKILRQLNDLNAKVIIPINDEDDQYMVMDSTWDDWEGDSKTFTPYITYANWLEWLLDKISPLYAWYTYSIEEVNKSKEEQENIALESY